MKGSISILAAVIATALQAFSAPAFPIIPLAVQTSKVAATSRQLVEKTVQDIPGKLVLEISIPGFRLQPAVGAPGQQVDCPGCGRNGRPGAPDLPVYRFDVLSGAAMPQVGIRILESETRTVPGIAPYPKDITPTRTQYAVDAGLYLQASAAVARLSGVRYLRGVPIRGIEIPVALWSEGGKSLTLIKRMQVEVSFGGAPGRPAANRLPAEYAAAVKNPVGGIYAYTSGRVSTLRKGAAMKATLGGGFLKIKIGDRDVENLDEDRVYGLSFADLVRVSGDLNGVRIANLRMYTGGNDTLPRNMTATVLPGTLREIPIEVRDNNHDGTFDDGDSVRFFAHGSSVWRRLPGQFGPIRYEFGADPYSFENYYYLDYSDQAGEALRLPESPSLLPVSTPKTSAYAYLRAEKDLQTGACDPSGNRDEETGFNWFWYWKGRCNGYDTAITLTRAQLLDDEVASLPDLDLGLPNDSLYVGVYVPYMAPDSSFTVYFGGQGGQMAFLPLQASPGSYYVWTGPLKNAPSFQLDSLYWPLGKRFKGYTVSYRRKFVFSDKPVWIFPSDFGRPVTYKVQGGPGVTCLRVEDGVATRRMILDAQGTFTDSLGADADAKYFLYRGAAALPFGNIEQEVLPPSGTALRNLETGDGENPEYLIIAPRALIENALKLKDYRNQPARALRLKTSLVRVEDIYRQFSSGRMSPVAIRDFLRWAYNGWGSPGSGPGPLKYVLLYGDGHYDYRNIKASLMKSPPPNLIPPFEFLRDDGSEEIASEDFFAALDSGDNDLGNAALDIAIGRLPVQNNDQGTTYLQKIKDYEDPLKAGEWRGRIVMAADDATQRGSPGDLDPITGGHTTDCDSIGKVISGNEKGVTTDKVYLLDYPMNSSFHKPEAEQDLLALINRGTLVVNYVGHGAYNQWADEILLQTNDALARMHNEGHTPMINAFSCTVGRFESLISEGMSEEFVRAKGIGAIGAISATRESYPTQNINLARAFYRRAFPEDSANNVSTVGMSLQDAKNSYETQESSLNDLKYALLGEPVLLLRKPKLGVTFLQTPDTLKALDCNTIKGTITGGSGEGFVNLKIVSGSIHKIYDNLGPNMVPQQVDKRGNILFERTFAYKDFAFSTDYFIPRQISFGDSTALITAFAWDGSQEREGTTAKQNLHILGTARSCASDADGKGPRIKVMGCQPKETDSLDFPNRVKLPLPYCLQIQVTDSSGGVLTAEGPDEGTTLEIPGVMEPFHPQPGLDELYNKSYQLTLDTKTFQPGQRLLKISARDGYGNLSTRQMVMDLTSDSSLNTVSAYNVPNPMKRNGTTFYFSTVLPSEELQYGEQNNTADRVDFEIRVYNQTGNLVRVFPNAQSGATAWDGRDQWGQLLGNGVYFYKITARQNLASLGGVRPTYRTLSSKRNILVISR